MDWVDNFEEKLGHEEISKVVKDLKKQSIYRVSTCTKELNPRAYLPRVVSFGPYHCNEVELKLRMDVHKRKALHDFLKNSEKPLRTFVSALQAVLPDLMASYDSLDTSWQPDKFLQLMLLDGCFMLEILRANKAINKPGDIYGDYDGDADPIFSYHGKVYVMPYIKRDMLMLENQLPMLLLWTLVTVEATIAEEDPVTYLNRIILNFVNPNYEIPYHHRQVDSRHVLDLNRRSLLGLGRNQQTIPISILEEKKAGLADHKVIVCSATRLGNFGVYVKRSNSTSIMDISFHMGDLMLPAILVDDTTELAFLNLMAFERAHAGAGYEVTSFVSLMDNLIDSAEDVSVLHNHGILYSHIGSEKAIVDLFHRISKDLMPDPLSNMEVVLCELDSYCSGRWNKWKYVLRGEYFKDPWVIFTITFTIYGLLFTITQTIYAILSYHHPLKPASF